MTEKLTPELQRAEDLIQELVAHREQLANQLANAGAVNKGLQRRIAELEEKLTSEAGKPDED